MTGAVICDICGVRVTPHGHYLVKMEIYADPTMPELNTEELEDKAPADEMKKLIEQMNEMSAEELLDQVHRQFEFRICARCQASFLANPLGLPRGKIRMGEN